MRPESLTASIEKRIARKRGDVFLRADFSDLGGYDQVGRVLRALVRSAKLVKIGQGLYARASTSPFDGRTIPIKSLQRLSVEALGRLGVRTMPTRLERDYDAGRTTQVPAGRAIGVTKRVRRKIGFNGVTMRFERARP